MDIPYEKMPNLEGPSSSAAARDMPYHVEQAPARIRHYFLFSLFSAICLCPATGLIALAYSLKSSAKADVKFHDKARLYSRRALIWNLISVIISVLSIFLVLASFFYLSEAMKMYERSSNYLYENPGSFGINNQNNDFLQAITNEK